MSTLHVDLVSNRVTRQTHAEISDYALLTRPTQLEKWSKEVNIQKKVIE
jgi:hypothetical protein